MPLPPIVVAAIAGIIGLIVILVVGLVLGQFVRFWLRAMLPAAGVSVREVIVMWLRGDDVRAIVLSRARLNKAGVDVPLGDIVAHSRAGGNVPALASAILTARAAGRGLRWDLAAKADLDGLDVAALTAEALGQTPPRQDRSPAERSLTRTITSTPAPPPAGGCASPAPG